MTYFDFVEAFQQVACVFNELGSWDDFCQFTCKCFAFIEMTSNKQTTQMCTGNFLQVYIKTIKQMPPIVHMLNQSQGSSGPPLGHTPSRTMLFLGRSLFPRVRWWWWWWWPCPLPVQRIVTGRTAVGEPVLWWNALDVTSWPGQGERHMDVSWLVPDLLLVIFIYPYTRAHTWGVGNWSICSTIRGSL